jgi:CBS domain-containing protein
VEILAGLDDRAGRRRPGGDGARRRRRPARRAVPATSSEGLLARMEPDEAEPVRRLLAYDEHSAGGLMTSEPVILPPEATIAEALALVRTRRGARRRSRRRSSSAAHRWRRLPVVTSGSSTSRRLLREPPHAAVGSVLDKVKPLHPAQHRRPRCTGCSRPTTSSQRRSSTSHGRLVGAVTVDDVLDHILPEDWRGGHPWLTDGAPTAPRDAVEAPGWTNLASSAGATSSPGPARRLLAGVASACGASSSPGSWGRRCSSSG